MVHFRRILSSALGAAMLGASAYAATEAPRGTVVLWSADDQWVRIERQDDTSAPPNDHPVALSATAVANVLATLRLQDPKTGSETGSVFAQEELSRLAPQLSAGLAKAGPRQDVTFSTIGSHPLGGSAAGLIRDTSVNAGRVFYEGGKLHVIFGELHTNYRKRNLYGQRTEDFEPRRQGARRKASEQKWRLAAAPGVAHQAARDGSMRADWVTIDTAVDRPSEAAPTQATAAAAPEPARPTAAPEAAAASPSNAEAPASGGAAGAASASSPATSAEDLERRLKVLKELRDKGLISEEAYQARQRELLSEL